MKKKKKEHKITLKKKAMRLFLFGSASIAIIVYFFVMVVGLAINIMKKYDEKEDCSTELTKLRKKEEELQLDVIKLQDPEYIGRYLREKFYYTKNNEYVIKIPD